MNDSEKDALLATLYDLEYAQHTEDIDFYRQFASALDADHALPVLELGCGTGRILVRLAEEGFSVTGVDSSAAMLEICAEATRERGVSDRVNLVQADMRHPADLPHARYNLAFSALNTFAYLLTTEDQLAMLRSVRTALVQHGLLVLDMTPPWPHLLPPSDGGIVHAGTFAGPHPGSTVHKLVTGHVEPATQTHRVRFFYETESADGTLQRVSTEQVFRWTGRYEMELLLQAAGYSLDQLYGSYDLDDFNDDSERMIFVART